MLTVKISPAVLFRNHLCIVVKRLASFLSHLLEQGLNKSRLELGIDDATMSVRLRFEHGRNDQYLHPGKLPARCDKSRIDPFPKTATALLAGAGTWKGRLLMRINDLVMELGPNLISDV
jgi:hypothetical protein